MSGPRGRRGLALLLVTFVAFAAASAAPAAGRPTVKRLSVFGLGQGIGRVRSQIVDGATQHFTALPPGAWGGVYTVKSGAHVTIYSSSAYPADPTVNQAAADFVDSLVHGSEISKVKIFFAPPAPFQRMPPRASGTSSRDSSRNTFGSLAHPRWKPRATFSSAVRSFPQTISPACWS